MVNLKGKGEYIKGLYTVTAIIPTVQRSPGTKLMKIV